MSDSYRRLPLYRAIAWSVLVFCLSPFAAQAQVLYGSITGNVTDPSGAVIAKATVEALDNGTGVTQSATTDSRGNYRFNAVQPGTYKVTVSAVGFASKAVDQVSVLANTIQRVDAQLGIASQQQTVEVTGEAPLLQTDKADVHSDLSAKEIDSLAISGSQGRNFQNLLRIIPGAGLQSESNSIAANPQRAATTNINGQSSQTINTRLDGAQDAYPWLPANVAYVPPADAIETVNVVTNSFDAEQGMAGGAAVNVQIKSGTNKFHGTAHEFHTDQNFTARDYFKTDVKLFPKKNRNNQNSLVVRLVAQSDATNSSFSLTSNALHSAAWPARKCAQRRPLTWSLAISAGFWIQPDTRSIFTIPQPAIRTVLASRSFPAMACKM